MNTTQMKDILEQDWESCKDSFVNELIKTACNDPILVKLAKNGFWKMSDEDEEWRIDVKKVFYVKRTAELLLKNDIRIPYFKDFEFDDCDFGDSEDISDIDIFDDRDEAENDSAYTEELRRISIRVDCNMMLDHFNTLFNYVFGEGLGMICEREVILGMGMTQKKKICKMDLFPSSCFCYFWIGFFKYHKFLHYIEMKGFEAVIKNDNNEKNS